MTTFTYELATAYCLLCMCHDVSEQGPPPKLQLGGGLGQWAMGYELNLWRPGPQKFDLQQAPEAAGFASLPLYCQRPGSKLGSAP